MIDPATIVATVDEIASYIRVRTRDVNGDEVGTFNTDTRPTADEATVKAQQASRYVSLKLGAPLSAWVTANLATITDLSAIYAAWMIETSFYDDGTTEEESLAESLEQQWTDTLSALVASIDNEAPGSFQITSIKQVVDPAYTAHCTTPCEPCP